MRFAHFGALPVSLVLTATCVAVGGGVAGREGALGALVGGILVYVFFASSPVVLGPVVKVSPQLSLAVATTFFLTKVVALVAIMSVLLDTDGLGQHLDKRSLGVTVIVMTLAWTFLLIRAAKKQRIPIYDLGDTAAQPPDNLNPQERERPE